MLNIYADLFGKLERATKWYINIENTAITHLFISTLLLLSWEIKHSSGSTRCLSHSHLHLHFQRIEFSLFSLCMFHEITTITAPEMRYPMCAWSFLRPWDRTNCKVRSNRVRDVNRKVRPVTSYKHVHTHHIDKHASL